METDTLNSSATVVPVSLRVSVTDLCQNRCLYCTPPEGVELFPRWRVLRYEQILRFVQIIKKHFGLQKLRITGGEPLVRSGILDFIRMLADEEVEDLAMTTNGLALAEYASELGRAGLKRITVSLDSIAVETYRRITRGGDVRAVLAGIEAATGANLTPIKINATLLRGINDSEAGDLIEFAISRGVRLRFIELMPIGEAAKQFNHWFVSSQEVLDRLGQKFEIEALPRKVGSTSREFSVSTPSGQKGIIGVISSASQPFCADCKRLRLTATGELIGCLANGFGQSVFPLLATAGPVDEDQVTARVRAVMSQKRSDRGFSSGRNMVKVGG